MRLMNRRQLNNLPVVEQGNVIFDEAKGTMGAARAIANGYRQAAINRANAARNAAAIERRNTMLGDISAAKHTAMLQRSLGQNKNQQGLVLQARAARGNPMNGEKRFGVRNPQLGFCDPNASTHATGNTINSDFIEEEIYNAQEFNNCLTSDHFKGNKQYQDFPQVWDAPKGDFGGILTNEQGSADFSTRIVNDAPADFGYVPRSAPRRALSPGSARADHLGAGGIRARLPRR